MSSAQDSSRESRACQPNPVPHSPPRHSSRVPSNPRDERPLHRTTLEPPVEHRQQRSSSPRLHAAHSPSLTRRRTQGPSSPGASAQSDESGAHAAVADTVSSPRRHTSPRPPTIWPQDEISLPRLRHDPIDIDFASSGWSPDRLDRLFTSDAILDELANNEFSSPSTYPSFTNNPFLTSTTAPHQTSRPHDSANSTSDMPATTRRRSTTAAPASSPTTTSRGTQAASRDSGPPAKRAKVDEEDEDPFKSPAPRANEEAIDLTDPSIPPEQAAREGHDASSPKLVKLASFQCAICLDNVESMTLTHCGHIFCAQCLHSSLCVESTKGRCPMCRSKIDIKPREEYNSETKGFYPVELKLMTKSRKGKRKVGDAS